jgi:hypothetical protein
MPTREPEVDDDANLVGSWIEPRLGGQFGAVTLCVPSGYAAYVRICHPATDADGRSVSWSEVAQATGRTAHPLMQWHALVGSPDPWNFTGSHWLGDEPARGELEPPTFASLCHLLAKHTDTEAHCFFGPWMGHGWLGGNLGSMIFCRDVDTSFDCSLEVEPAFSAEKLRQPQLDLPQREYMLFAGPLAAATQLADPEGVSGIERHSPNVFWPADRSWFLASEIDFDSTLVGGSSELIRLILDAPELDSWSVGPSDSLAYDADLFNHVGAPPPLA